jgi:hypothetical protein
MRLKLIFALSLVWLASALNATITDPPVNADCESAISLTSGDWVDGTICCALEVDENACFNGSTFGVWYSVNTEESHGFIVSIINNSDVALGITTLEPLGSDGCEYLEAFACTGPNYGDLALDTYNIATLESDSTYYILVYSTEADACADFSISVCNDGLDCYPGLACIGSCASDGSFISPPDYMVNGNQGVFYSHMFNVGVPGFATPPSYIDYFIDYPDWLTLEYLPCSAASGYSGVMGCEILLSGTPGVNDIGSQYIYVCFTYGKGATLHEAFFTWFTIYANPSLGCTDSLAANFNSAATIDDGTCCYDHWVEITVTRDCLSGGGHAYIFNSIEQEVLYAQASSIDLVDLSTTQYTETEAGCLPSGCYELYIIDYSLGEGEGWILSENGSELLTTSESNTYDFWLGNSDCSLFGCLDTTSDNYDSSAQIDDGTCLYPGDINGDGLIDTSDLLDMLGDLGCTLPAECPGDLDDDGVVNLMDLLLFLGLL